MERVSIASLKAQLSRYLKVVQAGESIIVTDHGKPVAILRPVQSQDQGDPDKVMDLVKAGLARPAQQQLPKDFWELPRPQDPQGRTLAALLKEREEGR